MASDHPKQKIHPSTDVEAPPRPTTPLIPNRLSALEKVIPVRPGPLGIPATRQPRPVPLPRRRNCWCKCLCWTIGLLVLIVVALGIAAAIIYFVFDPKLPNYSVDNLRITDLRLNFDMSLYARFDVRVTAENPNKKIGIYYKRGGKLSVWYEKTRLCEGPLPDFYQGHGNKTVLDVALTGQSRDGNALMRALQEQQQTGQIPLDLEVRAPVSVKLGRLKMRKVMVLGTCFLVVDSLSTNNLISIKASNCKFRLKL